MIRDLGKMARSKLIRRGLSFLLHVIRAVGRHDCLGMAAEIAFQMMFAFFNSLLLIVAVLSILGTDPDVFNSIIYFLGSFLPFELYTLIRNQIVQLAALEKGGILAFAIFSTTWTTTTLIFMMKKNFERSYHVKETRSGWKVRLIAVYMAGLAVLGISLVMVLLLFGLQIARFLETNFPYAYLLPTLIRVLRLPVAFLATTLLASLIYWGLINVQERLYDVLPGALFFCTLWFISTSLFGLYLHNFPYYNRVYGTLGVFIVLMGWMYLTALTLLLGGEVNAEIYRRKVVKHPVTPSLQSSQSRLPGTQ
jgi:membrane protein